ncbi:hypothetical protein H0H81_001523 [Sphagnurus paluster]|uniref:DUF6532 domain-containing protein n=1 Tax=Sphagnurus paluster TaxID=117069 RepID=A0A9P7GIH1_9AGAR|nr:hypothetical protein H0H81_001523 [Sphagnurus paluster]
MTWCSTKQTIQSDKELESENCSSIKRQSKPSEKVQHKDKETLEKTQKQLVGLQKKLKKLEKGQQKALLDDHPDDSEEGPESEDEDSIMFSSTIKPIEVIPIPEVQARPLRRVEQTPVEKRPLSPSATSPPLKSLKKPLLPVALADSVKLFLDVCAQWAESCWANVQIVPNDELDEGQCYEFTPQILGVIQRHSSTMQSRLIEPTHTQVVVCFGFRQDLNKTFHYKDPKTKTGYCKNLIIFNLISKTWFKDTEAQGVVFKQLFNPIPLETIALIWTLIDHCISKWHSGVFVQANFKEDNVSNFYKVSLADLRKWTTLNPTVMTNKRKKLFDRAFKKSGGITSGEPQIQLKGDAEERARRELEGHTGETDSEGDKHDDEASDN